MKHRHVVVGELPPDQNVYPDNFHSFVGDDSALREAVGSLDKAREAAWACALVVLLVIVLIATIHVWEKHR